MNFTRFPRRKYIQTPTPIEPMPALSRALDGKVNLYVKRDDLLPGAGGNNFLFELMGVQSFEVVYGGTDMMGAMKKKTEALKA